MKHVAGVPIGLVVCRLVWKNWTTSSDDPPEDPQPSRRLLVDLSMQERSHQATSVAGLNAFAGALLGFESVLGVVGLNLDSCPNWKGAALAALAIGILVILISLADFVAPGHTLREDEPKRLKKYRLPLRSYSLSPADLTHHLGKALRDSEMMAFTTVATIYNFNAWYTIGPKKRFLTISVFLLILALTLGGIGVGVKAAR
ncbi:MULTISPECIES: hypothetical protein [Streptacidiphilus]|uniref:Uncharacterized protein n=1 Tax=Streptacidiphilus cavernicola TaxID=3342716 RepID=A0ABV6UFX4_9ACTN|nr:hypothetical protein [Streptacidiphilus jeojiense]